jgi:hypothetical protein
MQRWFKKLALPAVLMALAAWWLWPRAPDLARQRTKVDENIERIWSQHGDRQLDALQFFAAGGAFAHLDDAESSNVDQQVLVPLLEQLADTYHIESMVVSSPDDAQYALGLFVRLPEDPTLQSRIEADITAADNRFSGAILRAYGNRWMSLDVLTAEQAEAVLGPGWDAPQ